MRPNPSLERDLHRHGTWPARRCGPSSVARAKRHPGSGPSAQTLGRRGHSAGAALAAQPTAIERETVPDLSHRLPALAYSQSVSGVPAPGFWSASASALCCRGPADQSVSRRRPRLSAGPTLQAAISRSTQSLSLGRRGTLGPSRSVLLSPGRRPNCHWSGQPPASRLGRVALAVYAAPRGQVVFPASAAQLER